MPAFGFQKQFVMPILTGTKTSTIRKERKDGRQPAKQGDMIKLYYGMRTKQCELISEVRCISAIFITMSIMDQQPLTVHFYSPCEHSPKTNNSLAYMEGFDGWRHLANWFTKTHQIDETPFTGWHIQWSLV